MWLRDLSKEWGLPSLAAHRCSAAALQPKPAPLSLSVGGGGARLQGQEKTLLVSILLWLKTDRRAIVRTVVRIDVWLSSVNDENVKSMSCRKQRALNPYLALLNLSSLVPLTLSAGSRSRSRSRTGPRPRATEQQERAGRRRRRRSREEASCESSAGEERESVEGQRRGRAGEGTYRWPG